MDPLQEGAGIVFHRGQENSLLAHEHCRFLNFAIGLLIAVGRILGGYAAAFGGHMQVLMQPYEFVIIGGAALGIFIVSNTTSTIKDCGKAFLEAALDRAPKPRDYLDVLSVLHALMRELRAKSRGEVESHFEGRPARAG